MIILKDIAIVMRVTILLGMFAFHFQWKKKYIYKNDNDAIVAVVCAKQTCSLTSGEYKDL